jgi:hypothetical protein
MSSTTFDNCSRSTRQNPGRRRRPGNLPIAEFHGQRIRKVNRHGTITTVAGTGDPGLSADHGRVTLSNPWGVDVDRHGILYIADNNAKHIWAVRHDGS